MCKLVEKYGVGHATVHDLKKNKAEDRETREDHGVWTRKS